MSHRKCPKCGEIPFRYDEIVTGVLSWETEGDAIIDGGRDDGLGFNGVFANCKCGNRWKLRGIMMITDLFPNN